MSSENLGHLLHHEVDGLALVEEQGGDEDLDQLTAQLCGPKYSDSSSWEARCQSQLKVWFGSCLAKVENSRAEHLKR